MGKIFTVALWEIRKSLRKPIFWIITLILPALLFLATHWLSLAAALDLTNLLPRSISTEIREFLAPPTQKPIGYFDEAGLLTSTHPKIPESRLLSFTSLEEGQEALEAEEIEILYHLEKGYPLEGKLNRHRSKAQGNKRSRAQHNGNPFQTLLRLNLLSGDVQMTERVDNLLRDSTEILHRKGEELGFFANLMQRILVALSFIWTFCVAAGAIVAFAWVNAAFAKEKESLTLETLLTSVSARQLIIGKVIAFYATSMLRISILFLMAWYAQSLISGWQIWILTALWKMYWKDIALGLTYFLLFTFTLVGFALRRASRSAREDTTSAMLFIGTVLGSMLTFTAAICIRGPDSTFSWILSIFPLSSPVAIVVRSFYTNLPPMEIALSLGILALLCALSLKQSQRFFSVK